MPPPAPCPFASTPALYTASVFFFHLSMVYALLRQHGLPLGKGDFDGWHVYRG